MNHYLSGLEAFKEGDYHQASSLFWVALKERGSAEGWNDWASAQLALGLTKPAEQGYRRALELDPKFWDAATNLALLLIASGRESEGIPLLERCPLKLDASSRRRMAQVLADCLRTALSSASLDTPRDSSLLAPHRISLKEISAAIEVARSKFPLHRVIVLHDGLVASNDLHVDCRRHGLDQFSELDFVNSVFVYACSWHFHGAPFIQRVIAGGGHFIPVWNNGPATYVDQNPVARRALEEEWLIQRREGFDKWGCEPGIS